MNKATTKRREERVKLVASGLANVGTASFIAGFVAPIFGGHMEPYTILLGVMFATGFHVAAQAVIHWIVIDDPKESAG